jgi:hypothetical protein
VEKTDYEDFVLRIRKDPNGYVATPSGPAEVGTGPGEPFASPFQDREIEELRVFRGSGSRDLDLPERTARSRVAELGRKLFETVFSEKVRRLWDASLSRARSEKRGLRLRLILESPELWDWPWEYLRDPDTDFLIFSPDISIVRCPEVPSPVSAHRIKLPLRVLVVIAQPSGSADLDSEREWKDLKKNMASLEDSGRVKLRRLPAASLAALRSGLEKPVHVLHFIGHGGFDRSLEQAFLQFETRDGEPHPVTGMDLARILRRQPPPALVVLNACEGGRATKADPFAGVAQALVKEGMPAVVAMQFQVTDESALIFAKSFYDALAQGDSVDHAVYEARNALFSERSVDWGNPVLYLRGSQGKIFDFPENRSLRRFSILAGIFLLAISLGSGGYFLLHNRPRTTVPAPGPTEPAPAITPGLQEPERGPIGTPVPIEATPEVGPVPDSSPGSTEGCPPIPDLGIVFKRIERGTFIMGVHGNRSDSKPHQVTITQPFCMSEKEITRLQWERVMGEDPSKYKKWSAQPVESVSWLQVQDYLKRLRQKDHKANFRLPTEAQWEYAARANSTTRYSFGDDPDRLSRYGNCAGIDDHFDIPSPVGTFAPNQWGLYDMQGNVSEWVADWYAPYDPVPQTDPRGPAKRTERVRRGGSFSIVAKHCTPTFRNKSAPDYKKGDVGFRIIRDVKH